MKTVWIIYEECNDMMIGIAKDIKSAIEWLIDERYITESTDVYCARNDKSKNKFCTVDVMFGSEWKSYLIGLADDKTVKEYTLK